MAIYGLGGVGIAALLGALAGRGQPIAAIDSSPEKRALAIELGATVAVEPGRADAAIFATLGSKLDIVIETVGKAALKAEAYSLARCGGRVVTVRLPNPAEMLSISAVSLVADGKNLMRSYMGSSILARDIP